MKLIMMLAFVSGSFAARLENNYLPPVGARGSGGSGLATPFGGSSQRGGYNGGGSGGSGRAPSSGPGPVGRSEPPSDILSYENENNGDGNFRYSYETSNGIRAQEQGTLKNAGSEAESIEVQGSYSYTDPEGNLITVEYTAGENGFVAKGDHLPTPPPIPEAILKSLEINAAAEASQSRTGGSSGQGYDAPSFQQGPRNPSFSPQSGYKY